MEKVFAALLLFCLILLVAGSNFCIANPYGPPNAIVIKIQNDGSVDPANSPLKHVGGNQYVLTENLNATIVSPFERYVYKIDVEKTTSFWTVQTILSMDQADWVLKLPIEKMLLSETLCFLVMRLV